MSLAKWIIRWLLKRKHSNCVMYAFCRLIIDGGEVRITATPVPGGLLRASWTPDKGKTLYSWRSVHAKNWSRVRTAINQLWFEGYVKEKAQ